MRRSASAEAVVPWLYLHGVSPPERAGEGCVTRRTMLLMIYNMGMSAEQSWRRLHGFRRLGRVIGGIRFNKGIEVTDYIRRSAGPVQAART